MKDTQAPSQPGRRYPAAYEKLIPVALGIVVLATTGAALFALAVALRLLPGVTP